MDTDLRDALGELENDDTRYVIVTNLDDSITDYDLRERFEKFGHVPSVEMGYQTEVQYGICARLKFALAPAARAACSKLGGKNWRGKRIQAYTYDRWSRMLDKKKGNKNAVYQEIPVKNKIFVGGLSADTTVHMLRNYFRHNFGKIDFRQSRICKDRSGHSKRFGFIVFEDEKCAQSVLQQSVHWIGNQQVNVGPVHEKKRVQVFPTDEQKKQMQQEQELQQQEKEDEEKGKPERSRSYSKSSRSSRSSRSNSSSTSRSRSNSDAVSGTRSSRSRSRSKSKEKKPATPVPEEFRSELTDHQAKPVEEKPEEVEAYKKQVAAQFEQIEEEEKKEKTLEQRRAERRARWKKRARKT